MRTDPTYIVGDIRHSLGLCGVRHRRRRRGRGGRRSGRCRGGRGDALGGHYPDIPNKHSRYGYIGMVYIYICGILICLHSPLKLPQCRNMANMEHLGTGLTRILDLSIKQEGLVSGLDPCKGVGSNHCV